MRKGLAVLGLFVVLSIVAVPALAGYNEAPMLAELVETGALPPVEERLPLRPFVIGPGVLMSEDELDWEVGRYGGTLRFAHVSPGFSPNVFNICNEPLVTAQSITLNNVQGNIVEEFTFNEDNTLFTFRLREGIRWSDGHPVTTADVLFAYEDVLLNEHINPIFPAKYRDRGRATGEPMQLRAVDDYTFEIAFNEPYGSFIEELVIKGWIGYTELLKPKHFLKQFHADYTPMEQLKPLLDQEELEDEWWRLFTLKDVTHWDLTQPRAEGFPVLYPWRRVEGPPGVIVMERNPFFHGVDIAGNQLPYIDRIESFETIDVEMENMKILVGEVDFMQGRTSIGKMPLYVENQERGGYRVNPNMVLHLTPTVLFLNYTFDDATWREVVSDIRFRQAINYAIDRQEIIDSVYLGFGSLPEIIPGVFDPDRAEELLDAMGLDRRDSEGFRLGPDGTTFDFLIEVADHRPDHVPATELVVEHLKQVGIRASMRMINRQLQGQRQNANEIIANMGWTHAPIWAEGGFADYLPGTWGWGRAWQLWYESGGVSGEEPPGYIKELYRIHEDLVGSVPDTPERYRLKQELFDWHAEHLPIFILAEGVANPMITNANLGNVPHSGFGIGANQKSVHLFFRD